MALIEPVDATTYKIAALGSAGADILLGGKLDRFVPNINQGFKFESGSERYWFNVNAAGVLVASEKPVVSALEKSVSLTVGGVTEKYYLDIDPRTGEQVLKWLRIFAKHPGVNVWDHAITCPPGVEFYLQPPLEQWEIDAGARRSPDVIGSYAVYCRESGHLVTSKDNSTIVNFRTGKMGHIYPPTFTDADGKTTRGELFIDAKAGIYRVTVDPVWFANAVFPVVANDTFGNSNTQNTGMGLSKGIGGYFTAPADGTVSMISACLATGGTETVNCGFHLGTTSAIGNLVASDTARSLNQAKAFANWNLSGSITNGTGYWLLVQANQVGATVTGYYDSSGGQNLAYNGAPDADTWGDSPNYSYASGYICSIYATYTAGGGITQELAGTIAVSSTVAGASVADRNITGSVVSTSALAGASVADRTIAGSIAAASAIAGIAGFDFPLAGVIAAEATVSGATLADRDVAGSIAAQSALAGASVADRTVAGTIAATSDLSGWAVALRDLTGAIDAVSTLLGDLEFSATYVELAGLIEAESILAGAIDRFLGVSGSISAQSLLTGSVFADLTAAGTISATSALTGALYGIFELAGIIDAISTLTGNVTTGELLYGEMIELTARLLRTVDCEASLGREIDLDASLRRHVDLEASLL